VGTCRQSLRRVCGVWFARQVNTSLGEDGRAGKCRVYAVRLKAYFALQLFLEEERERELEQMYESNVADTLNRDPGRIGSGVEGADADADAEADEVSAVTKQSAETLMAGEKIMDAIEMADADRALTRDYEDSRSRTTGELKEALMPPARNPTLIAMGNPSPEDYVRGVMEKVPPAQMEDALLVLPFKQVISLLEYLGMWAATVRTDLAG
jgi:U3 small nucleolar RNA-associated protein 12